MHASFGLVLLPPSPLPPAPTAAELWVDASNYTGRLTDQMMLDLRAAGVKGIIIQAITGQDGVSYTTQQCQMAVRYGFKIQGYVWAFPGEGVASIDTRLAMFTGQPVARLWADVEQAGLTIADVDLLLERCDRFLASMPLPAGLLSGPSVTAQRRAGVYSGRWFFAQQGWLTLARWSDRDLWDSNYDGDPVTTHNFRPYGGWTRCVVKQFRGTSAIGAVHEIDLDETAAA